MTAQPTDADRQRAREIVDERSHGIATDYICERLADDIAAAIAAARAEGRADMQFEMATAIDKAIRDLRDAK